MLKNIAYILLVIIGILCIAGIIGIRHFNNLWFKEKPIHLQYIADSKPINFVWSQNIYGEHKEQHDAILLPLKIKDIPHHFYFQFDTGSPYTIIYENPLQSLKELGVDISNIKKEDQLCLQKLDFELGKNKMKFSTIPILENYGSSFEKSDTITKIKLGTLGADFMANKITMIDFKSQIIQIFDERPEWMDTLPKFQKFDFEGRRFMLPAEIKGKKIDLFYDSGSSAFGLITSKNRYKKFTNKNQKEIKHDANRFGESLSINHKATDAMIKTGGMDLALKRVSYVDMYANFQRFLTPFTRIGGWLGNKTFTESILILDTKKVEFIVLESVEGI